MSELKADGRVQIDNLSGNCPVQAWGRYDGMELYFRARGNQWSLELTRSGEHDPCWQYGEPYGDSPFGAGWMEECEAMDFIIKAIDLYEAGPAPAVLK